MQDQHSPTHLKAIWEQIDDPDGEKILRQAIKLILNDSQELSPTIHIDKDPLRGINEGVPAEDQTINIDK